MLKNRCQRPAAELQNTPKTTPPPRRLRWTTYGKRKVGGRIVGHKAELIDVATIKQMYTEGVSTSAVAGLLATMKMPTKQQGKGWHNNTVVKILK